MGEFMPLPNVAPEISLCIGNEHRFAVHVVLPPLDQAVLVGSECVLAGTDGYVTLFVSGLNVFQLEETPTTGPVLGRYCSLSLSMLLEWVFYDEAYRMETAPRSFSEIIAGEASPDLTFHLCGENVRISWDLRDSRRSACRYKTPVGTGSVAYAEYLLTMASLVDCIIGATDWRMRAVGCASVWREWLSGYRPEIDRFHSFVASKCVD